MKLSSRHHLNIGSVNLSLWPRILHQNPVNKTHKSGEAAALVTFLPRAPVAGVPMGVAMLRACSMVRFRVVAMVTKETGYVE